MRRTGVRVSVYWISSSTKISLNFLQPLRDLGIQRVARSIVVSSGCPDLSSTEVDTCTGEMSLLGTSSLSRTGISSTVGEEDEAEEDEEEWLSCFIGVRKVDEDPEDELDKPGTTIRTKFSVLQSIRIPFWWDVVFDHWSIRGNIRFHRKAFRAIRLLACFRGLSLSRIYPILYIYNCLFMRLHFSIGGYDYRRTARFRQSIHFSITQVLFADHVHWRSGVDNKFSFLRFKSWCRQAPIFRRWEECCSFMLL